MGAYQNLVKEKAKFCKGKTTKAAVKKKAAAYIKSAVKKGKTKSVATKSANRVLNGGCSISSVAGTRKRKPAKRKAAKRK